MPFLPPEPNQTPKNAGKPEKKNQPQSPAAPFQHFSPDNGAGVPNPPQETAIPPTSDSPIEQSPPDSAVSTPVQADEEEKVDQPEAEPEFPGQDFRPEPESEEMLDPDNTIPLFPAPAEAPEAENETAVVDEDASEPETSQYESDAAEAVATDFFPEPETAQETPPEPAESPFPFMPPPGNGPLAGVKILDLTRFYPGPLATMMMADLGAEVIKIEDMIKPDKMRSYPPLINGESAGFMAVNRSKRSLSIKLNEEEGQDIFFQLVRKADIVVEQFNPGVLDGIGMGYIEAIKVNPRIIYVSLTGYGQTGPYKNKASHDINFMGFAGLIGATGNEKGGKAVPGAQFADVGGAYMAIIGALSALWARERTGVGQKIDVSMLDALLPMMTMQMAQYWATSQQLPPWQMPFSGGLPYYNIYKCKDGKYVALGALEPQFWKRFCEIAGKPKWIGRISEKGRQREGLKKELARLFKGRKREEWIYLVGESETCLTPVLEVSEVENDPQLQERGMIIEHLHPEHGRIKGIGIPIKFSHTKPDNPTPAPSLGRDTREILREIGYAETEISSMKKKGVIFTGE